MFSYFAVGTTMAGRRGDQERAMKAMAAIADGKGGYAVDEVEIGDPGPGELQVAIQASGVCHTDLKVLPRWPAMRSTPLWS